MASRALPCRACRPTAILMPGICSLFSCPAGTRAAFIERMTALGIGTGIHFEAVHLTTYYREALGCRPGQCPVAEDVCSRVVSLPLYPLLTDADVERVVKAVRSAIG